MNSRSKRLNARLMCGAGAAAILALSSAAQAEVRQFDIPAQSLGEALARFGSQSDLTVVTTTEITRTKSSQAVIGAVEPEIALAQLLEGTDLTWRREGDTFLIVRADDPQGGSAAGDGAEGTVEALIVTAQKREEDIQDVPIAISAFTQEQLTDRQVAGGPDLMTQVPNMTFTKTNFTGYSIQIRGIGTQAISATTDPAVAVAFNNTPFVRNRFFEQEFYDLQRIEVLRGPQGTLYGRNATAGVVNLISQKPKFVYEAKISGDVSNYNSTRLEGMVNVPLVEDMVALRLAGAWTKRDGFVTNQITGNPIDGRDLWSTRLSLRFSPTDSIDANLIWEHFEEDDDRLRSGKQLCKTDIVTEIGGLTHVGTVPLTDNPGLLNSGQGSSGWNGAQGVFSQGCAPSSLYSPDSFQTPNGISLPYYLPLSAVFLPAALDDPYVSRTQSHDLRVIESTVDPSYKAKSDIVEIQLGIDLTDSLSLSSETAWASDFIFATQDLNRFNTASGAWEFINPNSQNYREGVLTLGPNGYPQFCDPQVGCADRLVAVDLSTARSRTFSQEFRLASNYEGSFNFSLGTNFLRYDTEDKYYVFVNSLSLIAAISPFNHSEPFSPYVAGVTDNSECLMNGGEEPDPAVFQSILTCTYIDPNPIGSLNDQGHNYFLSRNPYKLISYAVFGEAYYNITETLKVTAGLRWTVDKKEAPRIPSWVLAAATVGYPVMEVVEQEWREPTGRLTIDWKPDFSFTDETLLYASYAHGYKAGGANPPPYGVALWGSGGVAQVGDLFIEESATNPKTFDAEFVDAFEVGAKNTLLDGRVTLNLAGFYYDYKGYQISQIVDRSATNLNFDSEVWGLELEADWRPLENLKLGLKLGYENTRVADGEQAIDIMNRTAGVPGWTIVRPFPSIPSNCILPEWLFLGHGSENPQLTNVAGIAGGNAGGCEEAYVFGLDPVTNQTYTDDPSQSILPAPYQGVINYTAYSTDPADFPGWPEGMPITDRTYPGWDPSTAPNNGEGFFTDLSGNELPNAPAMTATITADYTIPLPNDWLATLHTDLYYQSEAWTRIYNTEGYDKLKAYSNINLAAIFTNEPGGWKVMAYVKNVLDRDSITGSFLFSDDTGLTTNVFLTEPRLYGLRVTKDWNGGPWWTGANPNHVGPYPLTVELGGQVQRHDAPYEPVERDFANLFPSSIDIFEDPQNSDLDWGDGREVKLTYRPGEGPWSVAAGFRYGRTNGTGPTAHAQEDIDQPCAFDGKYALLCDYFPDDPLAFPTTTNWADASARNREEHTLVDFTVGRDLGIGGLSRSAVSAGVRYAQFQSDTAVHLDGIPGWDVPEGFRTPKYYDPVTHTRYQADLHAQREFEGAGPTVSWDAASRLIGNDEVGHLDVDWSLSGGVLFGKHDTSITGAEKTLYYYHLISFYNDPVFLWRAPDSTETTPVDVRRSESVTVPTFGVSLGLSYSIQRISIGAGYRWERYFDVLDVGEDETREADRTIDGPYFKLSVGFGG